MKKAYSVNLFKEDNLWHANLDNPQAVASSGNTASEALHMLADNIKADVSEASDRATTNRARWSLVVLNQEIKKRQIVDWVWGY